MYYYNIFCFILFNSKMARATLTSWEWINDARPPLRVWNTEVSVIGIQYTSVGVIICDGWTRWGLIFRPLRCFTLTRKASTMCSSATIVLSLWIQQQWHNKSGRQASALSSLSVLEVILYWLRYVGGWSVSVVWSWEVSASQRFEMY